MVVSRRVASYHSPSNPSALAIAPCVSHSYSVAVDSGWSDRPITFSHTTGRKNSTLAYIFIFLRPTLFSMSMIRALLPRPAASYAHVVAAVILGKLLLSCTLYSRHWGVSTTATDGIERRELRGKRRRTYDWIGGVVLASLRWMTMAAYIWIILKQPKVFNRTKWYIRFSWPVHRPKHASGRYACLFFACYSWSRFCFALFVRFFLALRSLFAHFHCFPLFVFSFCSISFYWYI